jgi:aspartyl-tRNA(Asn)/glutamyl-tRNA(Gln) amidotransferase subunit A
MSELSDLTAAEIAAEVNNGSLSAGDVIGACFDQIDRLDPTIQAWVALDRDGAIRQAKALDDRIVGVGHVPLAGIPFGVKDIIDMAGLPTSAGFAPFSQQPVSTDAAIVARLRELGAIPLGKTHTTQFAFSDPAPTNNPYLPSHSPGGSSSGSGAAVGARMVPFALGTQTAGSVLRPASYCGAVGFKPTFNWVSRSGVLPLAWSLDHVGLIARNVTDTALIFSAVTGEAPAVADQPNSLRLGLLADFLERADPEIASRTREAVDRLADNGATMEEIRLPLEIDLIQAVHRIVMQAEVAAIHTEQLARHRDDYGPILATEVEVAQLIPAAFDLKARRLRRKIAHQLDGLLTSFDAWILPTAAILPPARSAGSTGDPSFQAPWTMLGTPSISLPLGLSAVGLPIGLQLVGRRGRDHSLLSIASWAEDVLGIIEPPNLVRNERTE